MCEATASLSYSLLVRSATLDFAAQAWPSLKPTLPFFHQTAFRLRTGFLQSSSPRRGEHPPAVERVPVEVWEAIKHELIDLEVTNAEASHIKQLTSCCEGCPECEFECVPLTTWEQLVDRNTQDDPPWLVDELWDWANMWWFDERLEPVRALADKYDRGESATSVTLSRTRQNSSRCDSDSGPSCGANIEPDGDSIFDLAFDLPSDADLRLTRFAKLLRLEVIQVEGRKDSNGETTKGFRAVRRSEMKPEWRLFSTCEGY
ncbi:hypothetical protein JCM10207_000524 [Rhodosporidiobolus poonsookiae]